MNSPATIEARVQATDDGAIVFDRSAAIRLGTGEFDPRWFEPDHWRAHGAPTALGAGRGSTLKVSAADGDWVLRHYRRGGMVARLLDDRYLWNGGERTRGFAEFRLLAELHRRGLNVPAPVAARYRRSGVHYRADLITRHIAAAPTLADRLHSGVIESELAMRVGAGIAAFHSAGAYHADLNAHNILVDAQRVWLLDFDRGALRAPARSWQLANLTRLRRSLIKLGAARNGDASFDQGCWRPLMAAWERAVEAAPAQVSVGGAHG